MVYKSPQAPIYKLKSRHITEFNDTDKVSEVTDQETPLTFQGQYIHQALKNHF